MKKMLKKMMCAVLVAGMLLTGFTAYAEPSDTADTAEAVDTVTEEAAPQLPVTGESRVFLRSGMRAVTLTPGVDFCAGEDTSDSAIAAELPVLVEEVRGYGMNTVLINTDYDGRAYYDTQLNSGTSVLGSALESFREGGFTVFAVLDVNAMTERLAAEGIGIKSGFSAELHKFVMKYPFDGILLTNYYTADTPDMFSQYMESGSGIGYENWLYEINEYIVRSISEITHRTNNTVAVGLMINDMWANSSVNELGSVTADTVQALYDGHSDTKKYVEKGYADFVMVKAYGSTSDGALNFENVVSWWYDLCETSGCKAYVLHLNEKIGAYNGWYEDQLLRQLAVLEDYGSIGGSAFNSYASLKANTLGTTDTLMKYFDEKINTETIFEGLEMTSPTETSFVTYDSSVKFMGTFDENFDVYFDGKKIKLNEVGNFYFQKDLDVGWNSFVIEHKGTKINYSIERRVDVLRSVEAQDVIVEGGTKLSLVAVAYSGSKVSATIAGQVIELAEKENSGEELDANSSYAKFVGYYTVGDGMIGQQQYLGDITYYANYSGYEETLPGGTVTIEAKPEPPKNDIVADIIDDQSAIGTGEVVGTMPPIVTDSEYVQYVRVLSDYTIVYDGKTTGDIQSPVFSQLPAGTLDYYKSESGGYITTTSGKRFDAAEVSTFTDTGLGENALLVKAVGNKGGKSFIKIHLDYKSSFNITTPVSYHNDLDGAYGVESFDAGKVYITFDNVTSVTKLPDFGACALFSSGEWETVEENGVPKFRLALTLTQAGIYGGCGAYYDDDGDLMLTFGVPTSSLAGKVIVIDPGHGYGKYAEKLDPGAIGNVTEQSVNLAVAKLLEQKLTSLGATVIRLKTESEFIPTETRPTVARAYGADMFISLHCNSALNTEARGVEVYYFTSFSQPLARAINNQLASYYDNTVYADGTSSSRGDKYSYYWVTLQQDFPSVLVEMGFISNEKECMVMADPTHQEGLAAAIANGVYNYFARSNIASAGDGSEDVGIPVEPDEPDEPETPDTPDTPDEPDTPETPETPDTPDIPDDNETQEAPPEDTAESSDVTEEGGETADTPTDESGESEESAESSESGESDAPPMGGGGIPVE